MSSRLRSQNPEPVSFSALETRKILIVIPHLKIGGAQRQALLLAQELLSQGIDIRIALVGLEGNRLKRDYHALQAEFGLSEDITITAGSAAFDRFALGVGRSIRTSYFRRAQQSMILAELNRKVPKLIPLLRRLQGPLAKFAPTWRSGHRILASLLLPRPLRKQVWGICREYPDLVEPLAKNPSLLLKAHYLQGIIRRVAPDAIISFLTQTNLACLIAGFRGNLPVIVSERNDVLLQPVSPDVFAIRAALYARAEIISANSPPGRHTLAQWFPGQDVRLLANDFPETITRRALGSKRFGVVCRLEKQKNVDLIIRGFVKSGLSDDGWSLEVWGEGPELENLVETINKLGASQSVRLQGVTREPLNVMATIDFLLAASSYEGSSNSIHEAVSAGAVPLFAETITEMCHILPPGLIEIFSFRPTPQKISETLRSVSTDDFRGSHLPDLLRDSFERYWMISRHSRTHFLGAVTDMLDAGVQTPKQHQTGPQDNRCFVESWPTESRPERKNTS